MWQITDWEIDAAGEGVPHEAVTSSLFEGFHKQYCAECTMHDVVVALLWNRDCWRLKWYLVR